MSGYDPTPLPPEPAEQEPVAAETPRRKVTMRIVSVVAALVAVMTVANLGMAIAQTPTQLPTPTQTDDPPPAKRGKGPGRGPGKMMGGGIHGEFVTRAPNGGYQTIATQLGEVTAVSASSITVKSEDDFSRTYSVDDNTLVNAGNDGIADVEVGDKVRVTAIVTDGDAAAVQIHDGTKVKQLRERWRPRRANP